MADDKEEQNLTSISEEFKENSLTEEDQTESAERQLQFSEKKKRLEELLSKSKFNPVKFGRSHFVNGDQTESAEIMSKVPFETHHSMSSVEKNEKEDDTEEFKGNSSAAKDQTESAERTSQFSEKKKRLEKMSSKWKFNPVKFGRSHFVNGDQTKSVKVEESMSLSEEEEETLETILSSSVDSEEFKEIPLVEEDHTKPADILSDTYFQTEESTSLSEEDEYTLETISSSSVDSDEFTDKEEEEESFESLLSNSSDSEEFNENSLVENDQTKPAELISNSSFQQEESMSLSEEEEVKLETILSNSVDSEEFKETPLIEEDQTKPADILSDMSFQTEESTSLSEEEEETLETISSSSVDSDEFTDMEEEEETLESILSNSSDSEEFNEISLVENDPTKPAEVISNSSFQTVKSTSISEDEDETTQRISSNSVDSNEFKEKSAEIISNMPFQREEGTSLSQQENKTFETIPSTCVDTAKFKDNSLVEEDQADPAERTLLFSEKKKRLEEMSSKFKFNPVKFGISHFAKDDPTKSAKVTSNTPFETQESTTLSKKINEEFERTYLNNINLEKSESLAKEIDEEFEGIYLSNIPSGLLPLEFEEIEDEFERIYSNSIDIFRKSLVVDDQTKPAEIISSSSFETEESTSISEEEDEIFERISSNSVDSKEFKENPLVENDQTKSADIISNTPFQTEEITSLSEEENLSELKESPLVENDKMESAETSSKMALETDETEQTLEDYLMDLFKERILYGTFKQKDKSVFENNFKHLIDLLMFILRTLRREETRLKIKRDFGLFNDVYVLVQKCSEQLKEYLDTVCKTPDANDKSLVRWRQLTMKYQLYIAQPHPELILNSLTFASFKFILEHVINLEEDGDLSTVTNHFKNIPDLFSPNK